MKTAIDFGMYLTGNDRDTIEQMFNDWNSCNVASQPMSAEQNKLPLEWSPVETERKWQEEQMRLIFPNYENDQPDWQRLNFFLNIGVEWKYSEEIPSMSAEQVDGVARYLEESGISGDTMINLDDNSGVVYLHDLLAGFAATPTVKAEGWVSVEEKQRLESIIELKEKERQEWANMCIRNKKILDGLISGYCTVNEYMYDEYGKLILKEISETFLKNATKADRISDTEVFQALGETILNFPLPSPPKQQL